MVLMIKSWKSKISPQFQPTKLQSKYGCEEVARVSNDKTRAKDQTASTVKGQLASKMMNKKTNKD